MPIQTLGKCCIPKGGKAHLHASVHPSNMFVRCVHLQTGKMVLTRPAPQQRWAAPHTLICQALLTFARFTGSQSNSLLPAPSTPCCCQRAAPSRRCGRPAVNAGQRHCREQKPERLPAPAELKADLPSPVSTSFSALQMIKGSQAGGRLQAWECCCCCCCECWSWRAAGPLSEPCRPPMKASAKAIPSVRLLCSFPSLIWSATPRHRKGKPRQSPLPAHLPAAAALNATTLRPLPSAEARRPAVPASAAQGSSQVLHRCLRPALLMRTQLNHDVELKLRSGMGSWRSCPVCSSCCCLTAVREAAASAAFLHRQLPA